MELEVGERERACAQAQVCCIFTVGSGVLPVAAAATPEAGGGGCENRCECVCLKGGGPGVWMPVGLVVSGVKRCSRNYTGIGYMECLEMRKGCQRH